VQQPNKKALPKKPEKILSKRIDLKVIYSYGTPANVSDLLKEFDKNIRNKVMLDLRSRYDDDWRIEFFVNEETENTKFDQQMIEYDTKCKEINKQYQIELQKYCDWLKQESESTNNN